MCGIAGFIDFSEARSAPQLTDALSVMTDSLVHRGPDDRGLWVDEKTGVALGQRRLSIIDLSPLGHQPMVSADERRVIIFNGEIYNFPTMRKAVEAKGTKLRGGSDTEVLLEYITLFGVDAALREANGMFAFALWDKKECSITLARDRFGQKPLYLGFHGKRFFFASELKAIKAHPETALSINAACLPLFLRHNYIPAPYSIYEGIEKLPAGHVITLDCADMATAKKSESSPYWSAIDAAEEGLDNPLTGSFDESVAELEEILTDAVKSCMIADVPLGGFLSGGVDSSAVIALMQSVSDKPVHSFSIGFNVPGYNEAEHAAKVAQHLGTHHTELYLEEKDALNVVPSLPHLYDEPFADSSQIPTHLVCKMARKHVTVALSGDGGDEFFGGYSRYFLSNKIAGIPPLLRKGIGHGLGLFPAGFYGGLNGLRPGTGTRAQRLVNLLKAGGREEMYLRLISQWDKPNKIALNKPDLPTAVNDFGNWPLAGKSFGSDSEKYIQQMMLIDAISYMSGDILAKVDRAAMGVSLETRVPLLDHRVFETAWRIPFAHKVAGGTGKNVLRHLLYKHVPREIIDRPKMGFGVPIGQWLRSELKDWAGDLLSPEVLKKQNYLDADMIAQTFDTHLSGKADLHYPLWTVLMFQAWLQENA